MIDEGINRISSIITTPQSNIVNSLGIMWDLTNDSLIFEIEGIPSQLDPDINWNLAGFELDTYVSNNGKRLPNTEAIESPDQSILLDPK